MTHYRFFDNIDKKLLVEITRQRVNAGGLLRPIGKWLNAGIDEGGELSYPEKGTPQGAVISPVLSNIFLHHVLDDWFVKEVQPGLSRRSFLVRFADDFIIGCELESDARKVLELLEERFRSFALSLHPMKTKLIPFGKPSSSVLVDKRNGTFDFLGFTFFWAKARKRYWVVKKKTIGTRLNRFIKGIWEWCRDNRHVQLKDQFFDLSLKLRGYYQYYGVRGNFKALEVVYESAERAWRFWLSRCSHKGGISWSKFEKIRASFPFPKPRIIHNLLAVGLYVGQQKLCAIRGVACMAEDLIKGLDLRNRMREIFTYGSVGGAPGKRCFYPELDAGKCGGTGAASCLAAQSTLIVTHFARVDEN